MAKKQTRRSVSIRGTTYDRVRDYCERSGVSMSEFVEERIASYFGEVPVVREPVVAPRRLPKQPQPQPQPQPPKAAAPAPAAAPKKGNGGDGDRLSFEQLHDAARYFTF